MHTHVTFQAVAHSGARHGDALYAGVQHDQRRIVRPLQLCMGGSYYGILDYITALVNIFRGTISYQASRNGSRAQFEI